MNRRHALKAFGALGVSSALLRTEGSTAFDTPRRPARRGNGRVVDLVLRDASAWLEGPDGFDVIHGVSVRIADDRIVEVRRGGGQPIERDQKTQP